MPLVLSQLNLWLRRLARLLPPSHPLRRSLSTLWNRWLARRSAVVLVPLHGERLWLESSWRSLPADYERHALGSFLDRIGPGDVVWDVGAYIGVYTLLAAKRVGARGKVIAWEASRATFATLRRHVETNGLGERCDLLHAAVNDGTTDSVSFSSGNVNGDASINRVATTLNASQVRDLSLVPAASLDQWAGRLGIVPAVVKLDIEGAEVAALKSASCLLSSARPWVLLSVHPHFIWEFGSTLDELNRVVRELGYASIGLTGRPEALREHAEYWIVPAEDCPAACAWLSALSARS